MEEWAAKQPAALPDALEAVERISELLDLSGLFSALLLHPRRDRKCLSYTGGIRVSGLDFGYPCPCGALALSLEGVFQMAYILPERLLALVRPAFDLVLRRIRSLKRCVQACGCKIETPRYACNLAPGCISSEPTFAGLRKNKKNFEVRSQCPDITCLRWTTCACRFF